MLRQIVLRDATAGGWLIFTEPLEVIVARTPSDVCGALASAERRVREEQLFAAGFVCYEAAAGIDHAYVTRPGGDLPLVCFGIFGRARREADLAPVSDVPTIRQWEMSGTRSEYLRHVEAIREQIAAGNTYQVNYTVRQHASGLHDPWSLFLRTAVDAPYAAYVDCGSHAIISASPELFFELDGRQVTCKPMKGTAPRGLTNADDRQMRRRLAASAKDRAENVMIVDMVRNDLGRIAKPNTVRAQALFEVEKYRTVWQLTSTVRASTDSTVTGIFGALFPSASITGAPKVSSMRIIAGLEGTAREVYTGAIGYMAPGRKARFNVAIRTAVVDANGDGTYGVGGGIVWDSVAEDEYQECLNKARVLSSRMPKNDFRLLETLLWAPESGFLLLDAHLDRMAATAEYFDFSYERDAVRRRLNELARRLPKHRHRVRVQVDRQGAAVAHATPLATGERQPEQRVALAGFPVDPSDPFLYHKTTDRSLYAKALASAPGCDDVLLWNPDGYVTESTVANFAARIDGQLCTPPVECGLLAGTLRRKLLEDGVLVERKILVSELAGLEELYLVNSVRGMQPCRVVGSLRIRGTTSGTATAAR